MRCWPRRSAIRNLSRNPSRSATRNPRPSAIGERDTRQSAQPKSKELAVNLRREAIIVAIDPYAEAPTGNREFFLNKPPILAGNTRAQGRPVWYRSASSFIIFLSPSYPKSAKMLPRD
jgi:hypothetical protein